MHHTNQGGHKQVTGWGEGEYVKDIPCTQFSVNLKLF